MNIYLSTTESKKQNRQEEPRQNHGIRGVLMVARWEEGWGVGEKGEWVKKYKLVIEEYSWGCKVQLRECSQ